MIAVRKENIILYGDTIISNIPLSQLSKKAVDKSINIVKNSKKKIINKPNKIEVIIFI